jgi:hypothetical protein
LKNEYEIRGELAAIFLKYKGKTLEAIISTTDLDKCKKYKNTWFPTLCNKTEKFYVKGTFKDNSGKLTTVLLHRWLLDETDKNVFIDHIDLNPLNNTRNNIRKVTHLENQQNKDMNRSNTSGYRNVSWSKQTGKFRVAMRVNKKWMFIGYFNDVHQAGKAAAEARAKYTPFSIDANKKICN